MTSDQSLFIRKRASHFCLRKDCEAADIYTDAGPQGNLELARVIVALGRFDQLILENVPGNQLLPQWLHVSWKQSGTNRREIRKKVAGSPSYPVLSRKEVMGL